VRNFGPVPVFDTKNFHLLVLGQIGNPLMLSLKMLKQKELYEQISLSVTLKSIASRKAEFDSVEFVSDSNGDKFGAGAIGTAMWKGVRLA
jgi:hypothetical protein